jgi:hypothetical protein
LVECGIRKRLWGYTHDRRHYEIPAHKRERSSVAEIHDVSFGHPPTGRFLEINFRIASFQLPSIFRTSAFAPGDSRPIEKCSSSALTPYQPFQAKSIKNLGNRRIGKAVSLSNPQMNVASRSCVKFAQS